MAKKYVSEGEQIVKIANAIHEEVKQWDANNRLYHRPKLKKLVDEMCNQLMLVSLGNTPIE